MTAFQLVIAEFAGEHTAEEAMKKPAIQALVDEGVVAIVNVAVLKKNKDGKLSFKETQDVRGGRGALAGALAGGLMGLLAGPAGVIVGAIAGAVTGGVAANMIDMGFLNEDLKEYGKDLPNDSSALVALVELVWVERLRDALAALGATCVAYALSEEAQKKLDEMASGKTG